MTGLQAGGHDCIVRCIVVGLAAGAAFLALAVGEAAACEPPGCHAGSLIPAGGTIPKNAAGLRWHLGSGVVDVAKPDERIVVTRDGKKVKLALVPIDGETMRVEIAGGLVEGATYRVEADNACNWFGPKKLVSTFEVGPEAPMPTELGRLRTVTSKADTLRIGTDAGSCDVDEKAVFADLEVVLAPSAAPWKELIDYTATVDGKPWHYSQAINEAPLMGESFLGRGKDRVYARCERESFAFEGAGEGKHDVALSGVVFGSTAKVATPAVALSLSCADGAALGGTPSGAGADPGPPNTTAAKTEESSAPPDDRKGTPEAKPGAHASSCRVGARPSTGWLLLVGLALVRRRRR